MLSFLTQIIDAIGTTLQFLWMAVTSLFRVISYIPNFYTYTVGLFAWLPAPFITFALAGLTISLLLFLLGRAT